MTKKHYIKAMDCACDDCCVPTLSPSARKAYYSFLCRVDQLVRCTLWKLTDRFLCKKICQRTYYMYYGLYLSSIEGIKRMIVCELERSECRGRRHLEWIADVGVEHAKMVSHDALCHFTIDNACCAIKKLKKCLR